LAGSYLLPLEGQALILKNKALLSIEMSVALSGHDVTSHKTRILIFPS